MLNIETKAVEESTAPASGNPFAGMTIVVTGKVEPYVPVQFINIHIGMNPSSANEFFQSGLGQSIDIHSLHSDLEEFEDAVHHQYDFTQLPDFGDTLHNNIHEWFYDEENIYVWEVLQNFIMVLLHICVPPLNKGENRRRLPPSAYSPGIRKSFCGDDHCSDREGGALYQKRHQCED